MDQDDGPDPVKAHRPPRPSMARMQERDTPSPVLARVRPASGSQQVDVAAFGSSI